MDQLREVLAPDFIFEEAAGPGEPSVDALFHELQLVFDAFPNIEFRPVRQTDAETRTYVEFRAIGVHAGEFLDVPPTGTLAIISGVFNLEADHQHVRRLRLTVDFGGLRRQLLTAARVKGLA
jgi:hypothetical protein